MSAPPGTTDAPRTKKRQSATPKSYYDVPMLKPPVWKWEIATYFFLGGLSAGAYMYRPHGVAVRRQEISGHHAGRDVDSSRRIRAVRSPAHPAIWAT